MLVSGPDGPSDADSREFPEADLSDCDDVPELLWGTWVGAQLRACWDTGACGQLEW